MKLVLFIDGKQVDYLPICQTSNLFTFRCLLFNEIEKIKMKNWLQIKQGESWEIFIQLKSKL